ncbi:Fatty acid desaturase [hydrothermal vent metagenome]|uniref:Fatty acid desaturase n=1 Tax=hydrothermal vent metagenome TaxID=652676 RepID=A0A3B0Y9F1_9ZZZZ
MLPLSLPNHLTQISLFKSLAALLADWLLIGVCFAVVIWYPHVISYTLAAIIIARTQLALAVLMHESAHGVFHTNRRLNDTLGQVLTAAPLFLSMYVYRQGHMQHHVAPMSSDDPISVVFGIGDYPISRKQLCWRLFKDLTSIAYFQTLYDLLNGKSKQALQKIKVKSKKSRKVFVVASILAVNGLLFAVLFTLGHGLLYFVLWLLPALTLLQVFARIRAITEHAGYPPGDDQAKNARTIVKSSWQTFFFGPHCIHYHIEHHLNVRAPFYRLPDIHAYLQENGKLPQENLYSGYGKVLADVTF